MLSESCFARGRFDDDGETQGMSQTGNLLMVRWFLCDIEVACVKIFMLIAANFDNAESMQLPTTGGMMFQPCLVIEVVQEVPRNRCLEVQRPTII